MSVESRPTGAAERRHYSYTHYVDPAVAEGFDALRFGGPIGRHLLETQERQILEAFAPVAGRRLLDVGTGTGRASIALAREGADVLGLDASPQMIAVARRAAAAAGATLELGLADAHDLPLADRSVDGAVCLRVLMHAVDWRRCVAELCRVARWRVMVDFPALLSAAAIESAARRAAHGLGRRVEPYRVIRERAVRDAFARHGFRTIGVHRLFVLPIAMHKAIGAPAFTRASERALAAAGLTRVLGSPVTLVAER
ncbi:MAG: methyltransferase domain-containing protein [Acidobacteria bacterium]|nr:methyltransferase domain-containing protein [Acidobacteriota bacterium]